MEELCKEVLIINDIDACENSRDSIPSSYDDLHRKELIWETREENLLLDWKKDCLIRNIKHLKKSKSNKFYFVLFGVPSVLIPIILGAVSSVFPCNSIYYNFGVMCSGLLNGINIFFNFGKQEQQHLMYMNKYFELSNEIDSELSKPKRFRNACDVYIERIKQEYNNLVKHSPP